VESELSQPSLDRRDLVTTGMALALLAGAPIAAWRFARIHAETDATDRQRQVAREVAQLLIPRTDTPGGADVGADRFLVLALAHGLDGTRVPSSGGAIQGAASLYQRPDGTLDHLAWLERELDERAGGDYLAASPARRQAALEKIDAAAFASRDSDSPWTRIKGLLLTGYYTSQAGGSKELRYELVPGRSDPDIPLGPNDRAWSSDWTAVEFG